MDNPKPYVTAAVFCEKVLIEKDEVVSAIRVIDRVTIHTEQIPQGLKPAIMLTGFFGIKSGPVIGDFEFSLSIISPNGQVTPKIFVHPVTLKGGDQGQNFVVNVAIGIDMEGLYWFEAFLGDTSLTKTPLVVIIESTPPKQE